MLFIFLLNAIINCFSWDTIRNAEHIQARLLKLTKYSTLYELFNISQINTNTSTIKKKWRELMMKQQLYDGTRMSPEVLSLVSSAYDLMTKNKEEYDFLMDNPFYLTRLLKCNGWYNLIFVFLSLFLIVLIDFAIVAKRIITFKRVKKSKASRPTLSDMKFAKFFSYFLKNKPKKKKS
ncbi:hypothetical protein TUBRATIS_11050 [Tubulinosema ratisbonensis]|uniref:Uncharacterized protein n=1 Tax=Tubulinosema ratisbonensis TaxID=291195 RepID=A0A437AN33_9MICR|nr:hypothetical protein TUBRATIS_11050 [Tubulinosema ratisbonensis]